LKHIFILLFLISIHIPIISYGNEIICPTPGKENTKNIELAKRYNAMGMMFQKVGNSESTLKAYKCVLDLVPYSLEARYKYATALDNSGKYFTALYQYNLFLAASKDSKLIKIVSLRIKEIALLKDKTITKEDSKPVEHKKNQKYEAEMMSEIRIGDMEKKKKHIPLGSSVPTPLAPTIIKPNKKRKNYSLGINLNIGGPTLFASLSVDYFLTSFLNIEMGAGVWGYFGGAKIVLFKNPKRNWFAYFGAHVIRVEEILEREARTGMFIPIGFSYIFNSGVSIGVEVAGVIMEDFTIPIWATFKIGYRF
jgi:hypothetical protein